MKFTDIKNIAPKTLLEMMLSLLHEVHGTEFSPSAETKDALASTNLTKSAVRDEVLLAFAGITLDAITMEMALRTIKDKNSATDDRVEAFKYMLGMLAKVKTGEGKDVVRDVVTAMEQKEAKRTATSDPVYGRNTSGNANSAYTNQDGLEGAAALASILSKALSVKH